jgi:hypothetical protein
VAERDAIKVKIRAENERKLVANKAKTAAKVSTKSTSKQHLK